VKRIWDWIDARPHRFPLILLAHTTLMVGITASVLFGLSREPGTGVATASASASIAGSSPHLRVMATAVRAATLVIDVRSVVR
jgi:hypothetical protein